jgi:hypothetical protein
MENDYGRTSQGWEETLPGRLRGTTRSSGGGRPRGRLTGCLLWVIGLIVILIALALLFGGFQKGTKVGADARAAASLALPRFAPLHPAGDG